MLPHQEKVLVLVADSISELGNGRKKLLVIELLRMCNVLLFLRYVFPCCDLFVRLKRIENNDIIETSTAMYTLLLRSLFVVVIVYSSTSNALNLRTQFGDLLSMRSLHLFLYTHSFLGHGIQTNHFQTNRFIRF